jgi:hypothetical protein
VAAEAFLYEVHLAQRSDLFIIPTYDRGLAEFNVAQQDLPNDAAVRCLLPRSVRMGMNARYEQAIALVRLQELPAKGTDRG